jgi:lipoprotein-anchoring transpeptidase ErfK/SrfK
MSSHARPPGDGLSTPRVLAVGGAVATTAIALAGSLGFGPGAAVAARPAAPTTVTSSVVGGTASAAGTDSGAGASSSQASGRWLTVQDGSSGSGSGSDASAGGTSTEPGPASESGAATPAIGVPAHSGTGRRVVYDISAQRVWLVDTDGSVLRTYLVSGPRRESLVPPGVYHVYSRSLHTTSYNQRETMKYMVRFTTGQHYPIGFHDIPAYADGTLAETRTDLGTPMSAGCIRQWEPDARAMWRFAAEDSKVVVVA